MLETHKSKKSSNYRSLKKINRFISVINKKEGASCITTHLLFKIDTFGNVLENNAGNRRLDGGIIVGITFEYRRLIIGAEAQVGLVKINQQLRQVIDTEEFHNYLPRNFASFFTVGYKFR